MKLIFIISTLLIMPILTSLAQDYDAIIISDIGKCKECKLTHNGKTTPLGFKLTLGDKLNLTRDDTVLIQVRNSGVRIVRKDIDARNFYLKIVKSNATELKNAESYTYFQSMARSRNVEIDPPNDAIILHKSPVVINWSNPNYASIVFIDQSQKQIWKKEVKGKTSLEVIPRDIGLEPGKTYIWKFEGSDIPFLINIMDSKTEELLGE